MQSAIAVRRTATFQRVATSVAASIFREQGEMAGLGVKHGIGYGLSGFFTDNVPKDVKMCFWGGAGGSTILLDHTNRACFSYVMNQMDMNMLGDQRGASLTARFYEGLG